MRILTDSVSLRDLTDPLCLDDTPPSARSSIPKVRLLLSPLSLTFIPLICPPVLTAKLVHWIADPSSYVWLSPDRPSSAPLTPAECPDYNDWRDGLADYPHQYERDFVLTSGVGGVLERFQGRNFVFTHGLNDTGDDVQGCGPNTTG